MRDEAADSGISRRELLGTMGKVAAASVVAAPFIEGVVGVPVEIVAQAPRLNAIVGADRITVLPGKTYLNAWAGYGEPPRRERRRNVPATPPPADPGPAPKTTWSKASGPGSVTFADASAPVTSATFSAPGDYLLKLTADNGQTTADSTLNVKVRTIALPTRLEPVPTLDYRIDSPLWSQRVEGADRELDPALHRPDQPHGPEAGPRRHRQLRRGRQGAGGQAARRTTRATSSPTPGSTRPSSR